MNTTLCRFCGIPLRQTFVDLGVRPLANSFVPQKRAKAMEPFYSLHVYVCSSCRLVQLEEFESPGHIFSKYLYFSSFSDSWLRHALDRSTPATDSLCLGHLGCTDTGEFAIHQIGADLALQYRVAPVRMCFRTSNRSTTSAGKPGLPRRRLWGWRCDQCSFSYLRASPLLEPTEDFCSGK